MIGTVRNHTSYWAFLGHRLSGLALAVFLPVHFLLLGTALKGSAAMDDALAFTTHPLVKVAEWGLVVLLALHLFFGLRVLALEFLPWRDGGNMRIGWVAAGTAGALAVGVIFLIGIL
jgi:fumarate reductase subunit D